MTERSTDSASFAFEGVFDQLADALKEAGASPSTTLRQHRPSRRRQPAAPASAGTTERASLDAAVDALVESSPPPKRVIDRSRDHAVYVAPHRPSRPHFHSRPDDIVTERIFRAALDGATRASKGLVSLGVPAIAFGVTVFVGIASVLLFAQP